ncbi:putative receptor-like protein kinase [Panicum miliaceum]|uniref:Receptor-like protein kinase n=1 Tax=Panicum miliaceum TaxID=4540 RepID=A0A3L6SIS2_PANMI|nr:putative receptor-like protein kinase [Panicum miliaceum]
MPGLPPPVEVHIRALLTAQSLQRPGHQCRASQTRRRRPVSISGNILRAFLPVRLNVVRFAPRINHWPSPPCSSRSQINRLLCRPPQQPQAFPPRVTKMHARPVPAAALMCPAVLLLALLASTAAATNASSNPCAPARCGGLNITFPFWLAGTHPPECGYKAFQVTCDRQGNASMANSYRMHQLRDIFYENSSIRVALPGAPCDDHNFFNASLDFGLSPFKVSSKNQELFFLYDCHRQERQLPRSWAPVSCENNSSNSFALLGKEYTPGGIGLPPPMNCNVALIPVLGFQGATGADYRRLLKGGFLLDYTDGGACAACTKSGGQCRVDVSDDGFNCYCTDGSDWFICGSIGTNKKKIMLIVSVSMSVAASLLLPCIYVLRRHKKRETLHLFICEKTSSNIERKIEALIVLHGSLAPKRYKYSEVTKITSSLNDKLGEGGYGMVLKGRLDDNRLVAVKFLHDSKGEGEEFVNEVMSIGRTSHVNIVSLFGFCLEGSKRALIYEFMPNGSLDKYIYSENPKAVLGWEKLYTISIGIARGLEYLHHSCNTRIVHFDIKPQNILLDQDFHPKIADFGLAKLCRTKESRVSMTGARGTVGFIAPEVHSRTFGVVSTKSDVYSYGMMLLEMVGGRKNVNSVAQKSSEKYFPHWIYDHYGHGDGLQACEVSSENEGISRKMSVIGLWCIQILPMHRPTITKVLEMFERGLDELDMPPRQNFSQIFEDPSYSLNAESTRTISGT